MSKLAAQINGKLTGNCRALQHPLSYMDVKMSVASAETSMSVIHGVAKQCKIGVTFEKRAWVQSDDEIGQALVDIKRAIIEEVFGEFRPLIIEMRAAIYDRDDNRLRKLLAELENQMFVDGV